MGKKGRRPCPRALYDECPIPRELCREGFERSGQWTCLELLRDFEAFVFGDSGGGEGPSAEGTPPEGEGVTSLEELIRVLEGRG
jgi:hypothetical protein